MQRLFHRSERNCAVVILFDALLQLPEHSPLCTGSHDAVMREYDVSDEIDSLAKLSDAGFSRMQVKAKIVMKKSPDHEKHGGQTSVFACDDEEVIGVSHVVGYPKAVLHELIQFIEVDVREKLRGEVADGKTFFGLPRMETPENFSQEREKLRVTDPLSEQPEENLVIDHGEKLMDVALEREAGTGVVLAHAAKHAFQCRNAAVCALADAARIGMRVKRWLKERTENAKQRVVENAVANFGLVDTALFWVPNREGNVWTMAVGVCEKLAVQEKQVLFLETLKTLHIGTVTFAFPELLPGVKQILW